METPNYIRSEGANLTLITIIVLSFTFTILFNLKHEVADEGFHAPQIWAMYHGNFTPSEHITVPPTYHAIMAGLLKASGFFSIKYARFLQLLVCALSIPVMYHLCKELNQRDKDYRSLLFLTCPIVLPFFSILYTDIPATLVALTAILCTIKKKYIIGGIFGGLAVSMRQTNLIWVVFCGAYVLFEHARAHHYHYKSFLDIKNKELWRTALKAAPYGIVTVAAITIFIINKNVAIGDAHQHPVSLNPSNLYMFLILCFLFFLPYHIANAKRIVDTISSYPKLWIPLTIGLVIFLLTYSNSHPYNSFGMAYYFRNAILHYTITEPWLKFLAYIPIATSTFTFYFFWKDSQPQLKPILLLIYIFGLLSFLPLPMVEPRYYITLLALIFVTMPSAPSRLYQFTLVLYAPINCLLLYLIAHFVLFI